MATREMGSAAATQHKSEFELGRNRIGEFGLYRVTMTIFKMRGFNSLTGQHEYWQTSNPNAGPPTGTTLQNVTIAAVITQKEIG